MTRVRSAAAVLTIAGCVALAFGGCGGTGGSSVTDGGGYLCATVDGTVIDLANPLHVILGPDEVFQVTAAVTTPMVKSLTIGLTKRDAGVADMNFYCSSINYALGGASAAFATALADSGSCTVVQTKIGRTAGDAYEGTFTGAMRSIFPASDGGYLQVTNGSYRFIR